MQWIFNVSLAEANVATVTGDAFGNPDCIRFSYNKRRDIERSIKRIKDGTIVKSHKIES
jgi:aspartate/methionine/tyrosine aminotransferase